MRCSAVAMSFTSTWSVISYSVRELMNLSRRVLYFSRVDRACVALARIVSVCSSVYRVSEM